jgi:predicted component of type VI protein secretion system
VTALLELHISGPGLDAMRELRVGDPELVLGRDADCGVCLPDPERNVSRRHLAVWFETEELHFRVLSVVNGVEMEFGEAPPGARGVLPLGQTLKVGDYSLRVASIQSPPANAAADPWSVFERENSGAAPVPATAGSAEDDPFGDWEFESTFGLRTPAKAPAEEDRTQPTHQLPGFFQGLGLDPASIGPLSQGELEAIGRLVRMLMLGALELHDRGRAVKEEMRAEDRTMVATKDNNPLKADWPAETKLRYVFGGRSASIGFPSPERALGDLLLDLIAHGGASANATRAAIESTLKDFEPGALKARLLGEGPRLFEGTRAWDAYCKYYERESQDMARWTQRLLDRYYSEPYLRESLRIKRETHPRQR